MIVQVLCKYMMVKYSDLLGPIRNPKNLASSQGAFGGGAFLTTTSFSGQAGL